MKITFEDNQNQYLGSMTHHQLDKILVPKFDATRHITYLKRHFSSNTTTDTWKIVSRKLIPQSNEIKFQLQPTVSLTSLPSFIYQQNKNPYHYLQEFKIVEVEFGFHMDMFDQQMNIFENNCFTDQIIVGEMHKKRPCIIINKYHQTIQVIPITTVAPNFKDPTVIKLELDQIQGLPDKFKKDSYALLGMIQTVSNNRVYPLIDPTKQTHTDIFKFKLTLQDRDKIKTGLADIYNKSFKISFDQKVAELEKIKKERDVLRNKSIKLISDKNEVESLLLKLSKYIDIGEDIDTIRKYIDKSIT